MVSFFLAIAFWVILTLLIHSYSKVIIAVGLCFIALAILTVTAAFLDRYVVSPISYHFSKSRKLPKKGIER